MSEDFKAKLRSVKATQRDLAEFMKIDHRAAHRIVSGQRKNLTPDETDCIRRFFLIREAKLNEIPYVLPPPTVVATAAVGTPTIVNRPQVPLFGGVDVGDRWEISLQDKGRMGMTTSHPVLLNANRAFAVQVADDTMSPRFEIGEIAYVAPGRPLLMGQDCLVEFPDKSARLFRFIERTEMEYVVRQLNPMLNLTIVADGHQLHAIVGRG